MSPRLTYYVQIDIDRLLGDGAKALWWYRNPITGFAIALSNVRNKPARCRMRTPPRRSDKGARATGNCLVGSTAPTAAETAVSHTDVYWCPAAATVPAINCFVVSGVVGAIYFCENTLCGAAAPRAARNVRRS